MPLGNQKNNLGVCENWRLWCRLCAKTDTEGNVDVFFKDEEQRQSVADGQADLSLAAAIKNYFWVDVCTENNLPRMLCTECFSLVTSLANFSERVSKVQRMFAELQSSSEEPELDLNAIRLKYGVHDEDLHHGLRHQPVMEVHFVEAKPELNMLEERMIETDVDTLNPLGRSHPRLKKIKKEQSLEAEGNTLDDDSYDEDPFGGVMEEEEFKPLQVPEGETSSEDEQMDIRKKAAEITKLKTELDDLQKDMVGKKRRRKPKHSSENILDTTNIQLDDVKKDTDGYFLCSKCPRKFKFFQHYRMHMSRKHFNELKCLECSRTFTTQLQLDKHAVQHLPLELRRVVPCAQCNKSFATKTLMQQHVNCVHMANRPYVCEECGVAVRTTWALRDHMLTHTDERPFECEVCKKAFKDKCGLRHHAQIHDSKKYLCPQCGLELNTRATLNQHLAVHSDEAQHKCDYCGRAFKRVKTLKNHLILHTGLKPYSCPFCDRTFANSSNCRSHKKKAHPEELATLEAAGGDKTYTTNLPKLEALKAIARNADDLTPVTTKESGCFAFGKKPKPTKLKDNCNKNSKSLQRTKRRSNNSNTPSPFEPSALYAAMTAAATSIVIKNQTE